MFPYLEILILTLCNVISFECNNNDAVAYTTLLNVYLQMCIYCMNTYIMLYYIHIYTLGAHLSMASIY